eukprot:TRINITY_DN25719_c0_g2_i1.p2 TRINITY_DN25719_c0_g2~~TRINITY_DN25719_c0_g2_i1.p2  ORF type:complete len:151 (-),score=41.61 TRINITY_DN25719_c0_g2_i1:559-1011(-)
MAELRSADPKLESVPLLGIVKEVAPTAKVKLDKDLGVGEFQSKHFGGNPLYLDADMQFYKAMGNRKFMKDTVSSCNPCKWYRFTRDMSARLKAKGDSIKGNMAGEGLVLGGVLVVGPGETGVIHQYLEQTGSDPATWIPEVKSAISRLAS